MRAIRISLLVALIILIIVGNCSCEKANNTSTVYSYNSQAAPTSSESGQPTVSNNSPITTSSTSTQQPDDVVFTAGGLTYRANVFGLAGTTSNPWPTIPSGPGVTLGTGTDAASVGYRSYIETQPGQTRNNIINVQIPGRYIKVKLEAVNLPDGITAEEGEIGGMGNTYQQVISFVISSTVQPGQYDFKIDIQIDGKDYGTVPCTIKVLPR